MTAYSYKDQHTLNQEHLLVMSKSRKRIRTVEEIAAEQDFMTPAEYIQMMEDMAAIDFSIADLTEKQFVNLINLYKDSGEPIELGYVEGTRKSSRLAAIADRRFEELIKPYLELLPDK